VQNLKEEKYDLVQAARLQRRKFKGVMKTLNLKPCEADTGLIIKERKYDHGNKVMPFDVL
jgi:hypothetical protein